MPGPRFEFRLEAGLASDSLVSDPDLGFPALTIFIDTHQELGARVLLSIGFLVGGRKGTKAVNSQKGEGTGEFISVVISTT